MKKQFLFAVLGLIMTATVLDSCKKGENDPFLSLKSRKSRMAGEWTITKGEGSTSDPASQTTSTWTYDGSTYTVNATVGSTTFPPATSTRTMTITIEKDGTYSSSTSITSGNNTTTMTEKGTWNFTGKIGEWKNKDHVVFSPTEQTTVANNTTSTSTYTGDDSPSYIMYIDQLKSKEMVWTYDGTTTSGTPANTTTNKGSWTLTQ